MFLSCMYPWNLFRQCFREEVASLRQSLWAEFLKRALFSPIHRLLACQDPPRKHRKNWECCPLSLFIEGLQTYNECLRLLFFVRNVTTCVPMASWIAALWGCSQNVFGFLFVIVFLVIFRLLITLITSPPVFPMVVFLKSDTQSLSDNVTSRAVLGKLKTNTFVARGSSI